MEDIGDFFSLEALDTRIKPNKKVTGENSKWATKEFRFYLVVFVIVVPLMFKQGIDISLKSHPNYPKYEHLLSDGWLFGRKVDNSDVQYGFFRNNFFLLVAVGAGHIVLKRLLRRQFSYSNFNVTFDALFGLVFLFVAHGLNALKVLFHIGLCYFVTRRLRDYPKYARIFLFTYLIAALYVNDQYRDYRFYDLVVPGLDQYKGIIQRWDVFFNFSLLRIISFNMDYLSRLSEPDESYDLNKANNEELSDRDRQAYKWNLQEYNVVNYLGYLLYTPLFLAGPVITFNDYLYQSRKPLNRANIVMYGLRFLFCLLTMEVVLHFMYVVAIAKMKLYDNYTPFQISMVGLFNLNIIWLKLLIPWRFFRLWGLVDGMDAPENMIRCMDNNFSPLSFWRAWHRSFNRWVIRYVYVPLGGSGNRVLTSLAVFLFVAIWHDIEFKLLVWGWLVVLFLLPEIFLSKYAYKAYGSLPYYRHICGVGLVANIWLMMIANIYGFCLGHDGTVKLLQRLFTTLDGQAFFVICSCCLFVGVQIMYERREGEKRRGIDLRC